MLVLSAKDIYVTGRLTEEDRVINSAAHTGYGRDKLEIEA